MFYFYPVLRPILGLRIFAFVFQLLSIALSLVQPLFIGYLLDSVNAVVAGGTLDLVRAFFAALVIIAILDFFVFYIKDFLFAKAVFRGVNLMREHTLSLVLKQPLALFEKNEKGDFLNRILHDSELYAQYIVSEIPELLVICIRVVAIYAILFRLSTALTLVVMIIFLAYLLLYLYINKRIRPHIKEERQQYSHVIGGAQETIDGFSTIKINVKEEYFKKRFVGLLHQYLATKIKVQKLLSFESGLLNLFYAIMPIMILGIGSYFIVDGQITLGTVIAFYSYTHWTIDPIFSLSILNRSRQQAKAALPRLLALCDRGDRELKEQVIGGIEQLDIKEMGFSYEKSRPIFSELSLSLKRGDRIAITGESGVGKSTLAKLLLGIIQPEKGRILVNGIPLYEIDPQMYLQECSYLPQEVFLFGDSLHANITFSENVNEVLEEMIHKFNLHGLERSSSFSVGSLSGGEKQRVGLARAIYRRPSILVFDEPTSALDETMEQSIIKALDDYLQVNPCIFIVITHRKSLLEICSRELKMKRSGEIEVVDL